MMSQRRQGIGLLLPLVGNLLCMKMDTSPRPTVKQSNFRNQSANRKGIISRKIHRGSFVNDPYKR